MKQWTDAEVDEDRITYAAWLKGEFGDVPGRFPLASIVCFEGDELHEFVVVGYCLVDDLPTVKLIDLAEMLSVPYEEYNKVARDVCPKHKLHRLKYLYNQNGGDFARSFRT